MAPGPRFRAWFAVLLLAVTLRAEVRAPEYDIKAAFVFKFATYIRWPAPDQASPFVIGILGKDPFGSALQTVVRGQNVQGRRIVIRNLDDAASARDASLVFISASEDQQLTQILAKLRGTAVLTVSDIDRFAEQGGMIHLITTPDHHIHFAINKSAVDRAGLKAPSQLLRLARVIEEPNGSR
jgi:hypothetical protein